jgi:hypothetical protein
MRFITPFFFDLLSTVSVTASNGPNVTGHQCSQLLQASMDIDLDELRIGRLRQMRERC